MGGQGFEENVRRYIENVFRPSEGWVIEARKIPETGQTLFIIRRAGQLAIAQPIPHGELSKEAVEAIDALRDANLAYLAILYISDKVSVNPYVEALARRLGVRIVKLTV